jgi:hypothetical protein
MLTYQNRHCNIKITKTEAELHALFERITLTLEEEERETKVGDEDQDEADDHRARRALADALGTTRGGETPTAADH